MTGACAQCGAALTDLGAMMFECSNNPTHHIWAPPGDSDYYYDAEPDYDYDYDDDYERDLEREQARYDELLDKALDEVLT